MTDRAGEPSGRYDTHFVASGTLIPPGWIGRAVRLGIGAFSLKLFFDFLRFEIPMYRGDSGLTSSRAPGDLLFWVLVAWFFWILPHVVNIGFGVSWRRWSQVVLLASSGVAIGYSLFSSGSLWSEPLGWTLLVWILYESLHLGVSFVLAAFLATPGCEMRAIPHLWMRLTGRETDEHFCPSGFLDSLDRWEFVRRQQGGSNP